MAGVLDRRAVAVRGGYEEFVAGQSARLLNIAYLLTHDWALAEDLVQTALAKTWLAWRRIDGDPNRYVRAVLVNTHNSWWRRRSSRERPTDELPEPAARFDAHAAFDERDAVWQALGRLPKRQRAVVVLRYYDDLPEAEVARVLGCSVGSVKSQASRGLARLRVDPSLRPEGAGDE
jgi:RNA polymerase sigma-70 factor (sigma-E family)